jgi:hypothetical protein
LRLVGLGSSAEAGAGGGSTGTGREISPGARSATPDGVSLVSAVVDSMPGVAGGLVRTARFGLADVRVDGRAAASGGRATSGEEAGVGPGEDGAGGAEIGAGPGTLVATDAGLPEGRAAR